jgi:hypothetical protein
MPDTWETSIWREMGIGTRLGDTYVVDELTWRVVEIDHRPEQPETVTWVRMVLVPAEDYDYSEAISSTTGVGKLLQYESSVRMKLTPKARPTQWDHLLRND